MPEQEVLEEKQQIKNQMQSVLHRVQEGKISPAQSLELIMSEIWKSPTFEGIRTDLKHAGQQVSKEYQEVAEKENLGQLYRQRWGRKTKLQEETE